MIADWHYNYDISPIEGGVTGIEIELTGQATLFVEESTYDNPGSTDVEHNEIFEFNVCLHYVDFYLADHYIEVNQDDMSYADFIIWMEAFGLSEADMLEGGEEAIDWTDTYEDNEPTWHDEWMDFDEDC